MTEAKPEEVAIAKLWAETEAGCPCGTCQTVPGVVAARVLLALVERVAKLEDDIAGNGFESAAEHASYLRARRDEIRRDAVKTGEKVK